MNTIQYYPIHVQEKVHCLNKNTQMVYTCNTDHLFDRLMEEYGEETAKAMLHNDSFFAVENFLEQEAERVWEIK